MVVRMLWNVGVGLVHHAINGKSMAPGMGIRYPAIWRARPGFLDCDINLHLNNAAYVHNMELARWHFSASAGIIGEAARRGFVFLVASQAIRYRHPIPPFKTYEITSRIVHWDDQWVYCLHQFQCPQTARLYAEGLTRLTLKKGRARVAGRAVYQSATGLDVDFPAEPPAIVREFLHWDAASKESMEAAAAKLARSQPQRKTDGTTTSVGLDLLTQITHSWNVPFMS